MLKSPTSIQKQLSAAIAIIGKEDFPAKWPGLLGVMVSKFASGDFHIINGVLQVLSHFRNYRTFDFYSNSNTIVVFRLRHPSSRSIPTR